MNLDITFCSNLNCKNMECERNQKKYDWSIITLVKPAISISNFSNCEFWEEEDE